MSGLFMVKQNIDIGEFGNPLLNVFGYFSTLPVVDELNVLLDAFEANMVSAWQAIASEGASTISLEAYELNGTGYAIHVLGTPAAGERTGEISPPFVAWSFALQRSEIGKRSGGKRVGLISMSDYIGRTPFSGIVPDLEQYADRYGSPLNAGLIETWFPVILERPEEEGDPWGQHASSGALFKAVSTQNTRKK